MFSFAGLYCYKPLYEVCNAEEIVELIEKSDGGVIATELYEVCMSACLFDGE
jgi:Zn-finger protein